MNIRAVLEQKCVAHPLHVTFASGLLYPIHLSINRLIYARAAIER
jgi:hypothetical protein